MPFRIVISPGLTQPPAKLLIPGGYVQTPLRPVIAGLVQIDSGSPPGTFTYLRPDSTSTYFRPDGISVYLRP